MKFDINGWDTLINQQRNQRQEGKVN